MHATQGPCDPPTTHLELARLPPQLGLQDLAVLQVASGERLPGNHVVGQHLGKQLLQPGSVAQGAGDGT